MNDDSNMAQPLFSTDAFTYVKSSLLKLPKYNGVPLPIRLIVHCTDTWRWAAAMLRRARA